MSVELVICCLSAVYPPSSNVSTAPHANFRVSPCFGNSNTDRGGKSGEK
jgi:hypothetical protein